MKRKPWSKEDIAMLGKNCPGMTNAELAALLDRTIDAIKWKLRQRGWKRMPKWSPDERREGKKASSVRVAWDSPEDVTNNSSLNPYERGVILSLAGALGADAAIMNLRVAIGNNNDD